MRNLSPKEVASAIGVSESSVKRWCDKGAIPFSRTDGGHRRISVTDVLDFVQRKDFKIAKPDVLQQSTLGFNGVSPSELSRELEAALLNVDEARCRSILISRFMAGVSIARIGDELIATAFKSIGEKWRAGLIDVYQERQSCEICLSVLREIRGNLNAPHSSAPFAIGGTPPSDNYILPTTLVELVFRQHGWQTSSLGFNIPFDSMVAAAERYSPKVFWLSVSHLKSNSEFLDGYHNFSRRVRDDVAVVVGGRGLNSDVRKQMSFTSHCDTLGQLQNFIKTLSRFNETA